MPETTFSFENLSAEAQGSIPVSIWRVTGEDRLEFVCNVLAKDGTDIPVGTYVFQAQLGADRPTDVSWRIDRGTNNVMFPNAEEVSTKSRWLARYVSPDFESWRIRRCEFDGDSYVLKQNLDWDGRTPLLVNCWRNGLVILEIQGREEEERNCYCVPVCAGFPATLRSRSINGKLEFELRPSNLSASRLLDFLMDCENSIAKVQLGSLELTPQQLLHGKRDDPIGSVVGALGLIKLNEWEKLGDWPERLVQYRPWLPDALVIEAVAMCNRNEKEAYVKACHLLASLGNRIPIFLDSLKLALSILRYQSSLEEIKNDGRVTAIRKRLTFIGNFADLSQPVLTLHNVELSTLNELCGVFNGH